MEFVDRKRVENWLSSNNILDSNGHISFSEFEKIASSRIPSDSGRKTALSRSLVSLFDSETESLLWINESGIWPSCEDILLFDGFRKSLGEGLPICERPGHLFSKKHLQETVSLIAMVLYFCWGAILVSVSQNLLIRISHDETIDFFSIKKYSLSRDVNERINSLIKAFSNP